MTTAMSPSDRAMSVKVFAGRAGVTTSMARAGSLAGASPDKGGHLVEQRGALLSGVVEVRRRADAAAGAVVDHEPPPDELLVHPLGIAGVDRHMTTATLRVVRRSDDEPPLERPLEQRLGQRHRPLANPLETDVDDRLIARCGGVRRGDVGRATGEAHDSWRVPD